MEDNCLMYYEALTIMNVSDDFIISQKLIVNHKIVDFCKQLCE